MKNRVLNIGQYILIGGLTISMGMMTWAFNSSKEDSRKVIRTEQIKNEVLRNYISKNNAIQWKEARELKNDIKELKKLIPSDTIKLKPTFLIDLDRYPNVNYFKVKFQGHLQKIKRMELEYTIETQRIIYSY